MSEPMYLQGDTISQSRMHFSTMDMECECGHMTEGVESQEEYHAVSNETTWYAEWTCQACGEFTATEGWY